MRHPDPDVVVLLALAPDQVDPHVTEHLATCDRCRGEFAAALRTVELARRPDGPASAPLPAPPERVWDAVEDALAADPGFSVANPVPPDAGVPVPAGRPPRWVLVAATAAALVIGVIGGAALSRSAAGPEPAPAEAPISLLSLDPAATGTAAVSSTSSGTELLLVVRDEAVRGGYLEAWLIDDAGTGLYSLGGLVSDGSGGYTGSFDLPRDLPLDRYRTLDVSTEQFDGNPAHSGESLVRGSIG